MKRVGKHIKCVMDASALLAFANQEPYLPELPELFTVAIVTSYNLAEAVSKIVISTGADEEMSWEFISNFVEEHYPVDDELSLAAVKLARCTKPLGLSLGDRYCIALGQLLNLPVYTADKAWKALENELNVEIVLIR